MKVQISAIFEVKSWNESPFDEGANLPKLTRANVTKIYSGDIEGMSMTEWLMAYAEDGSATFVGLERVAGTFVGREGSVVLQHVGSFAEGAARGTLTVVHGSGTNDLVAVEGDGSFLADPTGSVSLNLSFV
jgi:hypothetical protein